MRNKLAEWSRLARLPLLWNVEKVLATNVLVVTAWVFFRSATVSDAFYILSHMFRFAGFESENLFRAGLPRFEMAFLPCAVLAVLAVDSIRLHRPRWMEIAWQRPAFRWPVYAAAVYSVVFFGVFQHIEFIYFQF